MFHFVVVTCVFLMACVYTTSVQHCDCPNSSQIEFNITGRRNQTGHWNAQMLLDMEAENKSIGPWAMNVGHKSTNCGQTETLLLNITLSVAPPTNETQDTEVPYKHVSGLGYYKVFYDNWKNWTQAKEVCEQDEAHLLVLNSEVEATVVGEMITYDGSNPFHFFIGITDQFRGFATTMFNQTLREAGYVNFTSIRDMGYYKPINCGLWNGKYDLVLIGCNHTAPFICEREE